MTALGRLEPKGKVIRLAAPAFSQGSRVEKLLVQEGDQVKAGQAIAILDNRDRLPAASQEAEEAVNIAQNNLATVIVLLLTIIMCMISGIIATRKLQSADPADMF